MSESSSKLNAKLMPFFMFSERMQRIIFFLIIPFGIGEKSTNVIIIPS